jgi:ureidoglycolate lyase
MELRAQPLTAEAFAPFGEVFRTPAEKGRLYLDDQLATARPTWRTSLSISRSGTPATLPLVATRMERHAYSTQTFVPLEPARYLILVAPKAVGGAPDTARAQAFVAAPGQGITYAMNTWHHPMTVLDAPAGFAVMMWRDGGPDDEHWHTLAQPITILPPA